MARLTRSACEDRDAVVRLLAEEMAVIAALLKHIDGNFVVGTFCFLHAEHVGFDGVEPAHDERQPRENGVNVPGCYQHWPQMKHRLTRTEKVYTDKSKPVIRAPRGPISVA